MCLPRNLLFNISSNFALPFSKHIPSEYCIAQSAKESQKRLRTSMPFGKPTANPLAVLTRRTNVRKTSGKTETTIELTVKTQSTVNRKIRSRKIDKIGIRCGENQWMIRDKKRGLRRYSSSSLAQRDVESSIVIICNMMLKNKLYINFEKQWKNLH